VAVSYEGMATHSGLIGVSTNKKRKSMFNHMTRFLAKYPYHRRESDGGFATTLDELPESAFDDKCTLMGKFSSYLDVEVANVRAWNTHNGLVSALHVWICAKYPVKETLMARSLRELNATIETIYLVRSANTGRPIVENTVLILYDQFEYTNMKLFELGHHYERGIFTLDFQTAGRITEVRLTHTCLASYITHSFL